MPVNPYPGEGKRKRPAPSTEDPLLGFNFMLELEGKLAGYFTECSGIGSEHDIVEHKLVDDKGHEFVRKIPGRLKWQDVTLRRGITSDLWIWEWRDKVVRGKVDEARKNITITMLDHSHNPVARWHFSRAWPTKCSGHGLKSEGDEFGIEEITIAHERMHRES